MRNLIKSVKRYEDVYGKPVTVRDVVETLVEDTKTGKVTALNGKLNVRPPYQREFVYDAYRQMLVIRSVLTECPLNNMYWAKEGDGYELLDGQQRTLTLFRFVNNAFSIKMEFADGFHAKTFDALTDEEKELIMNHQLMVYVCDGTEKEKLEWFQTINYPGLKLTQQEMRNAIYSGLWVTDAKRYFSRVDGEGFRSEGHTSNGHAYCDYLNVDGGSKSAKDTSVVRQKLLEKVLVWATDAYNRENSTDITIDEYMSIHRADPDAKALWRYYEDVMEWVKDTFKTYRPSMKGVEWGLLYNEYHELDNNKANEMANAVFDKASDEISDEKGVYKAVLAKDIKFIHARGFEKRDKEWAYRKQKGVCPYCHNEFEMKHMHADHIKPWSMGGVTERGNLQMLCATCNTKKSGYDTQFVPWVDKEYEPFDLQKWDS